MYKIAGLRINACCIDAADPCVIRLQVQVLQHIRYLSDCCCVALCRAVLAVYWTGLNPAASTAHVPAECMHAYKLNPADSKEHGCCRTVEVISGPESSRWLILR